MSKKRRVFCRFLMRSPCLGTLIPRSQVFDLNAVIDLLGAVGYTGRMPRPLRPVAEGLVYHVISRGNNRQPVFFDEGDYFAQNTTPPRLAMLPSKPSA